MTENIPEEKCVMPWRKHTTRKNPLPLPQKKTEKESSIYGQDSVLLYNFSGKAKINHCIQKTTWAKFDKILFSDL